MQNQYYVYVCYVNQNPVYVGKGKNLRYLHCTSGKSHNPMINKALLEYGSSNFNIHMAAENLSESDAFKIERAVINDIMKLGFVLFNQDAQILWDLEYLQKYRD
jgi:hypothetical protein